LNFPLIEKKNKEVAVENNTPPIDILVIDDEKSLRDGAERVLSRMGCRVSKASRGVEGLDIIEKENVSIVLLDMKMPGIDGMEVLRRIMIMDKGILVIVITGYATVETAIEAMKQGAYDFIPKPYEPDQLRIVVNRAIDKIHLTKDAEKLEREQRRTLADLHTEQSRVHAIIEYLPNGVMVTDDKGVVVLINPSFIDYMGLDPGTEPGKKLENYIEDKDLCKLISDISRGRYVDFDDIPTYELDLTGGKFLLVRSRPVLGEIGECLGAVVNLMDVSALKALDQVKSEFVAKVSHELRSPLSTIHEQLALVLADMVDNISDNDQHILSRAKEKTKGMISTIGDLLDLSRIEAGNIAKEIKVVCLDEFIKGILDFLEAKAKAKNQTLILEPIEDSIPEITADPMSIESIFGNLITNAINYTQEGGEIKVNVSLVGINIRVKVSDNGFGIDPKYMDKIFDRFYRVKNDKTRFITGTGLGLPIVKGLVDSLGGYIDVESEVGIGTTFTVLIPVKTSRR